MTAAPAKPQIGMRPIGKLVPYARNARTHDEGQIAQIAASIREFGWTNPILLDGQSGVIAGHARLAAARVLGLKQVPCLELAHLTEAQKRAYILADNKLALNAGWDLSMLAGELQELKAEEFDLSLLGFNDEELAELLAQSEGTEGLTDPDECPETPANPVTQPGDLWLLGNHRLLCGDATKREDVERLMAGEKAVLVATDPPYVVNYKGGTHPPSTSNRGVADKDWSQKYREVEIEDASEFFRGFITLAINSAAQKKAGWYIWHAFARQAELELAMKSCGLRVHQQIIWFKSRPVLTYSHFMWQHEPCFYGWLQGSQPNLRPPAESKSVWQIDSKIEDGFTDAHPTQKPIELFARPIDYHTKPGNLIYEPFAGSGTAMIAAEKLGRLCFAMELSPAFGDVIVTRWQNFTGREATLDGTKHTFAEISKKHAA